MDCVTLSIKFGWKTVEKLKRAAVSNKYLKT